MVIIEGLLFNLDVYLFYFLAAGLFLTVMEVFPGTAYSGECPISPSLALNELLPSVPDLTTTKAEP